MTIVEFIEKDLEARIRSDHELPEKLTLSWIAQNYDVSSTPAREAVKNLIDKSLVLRMENGRLEYNPKRKGTSKKSEVDRPQSMIRDCHSILAHEVFLQSLRGEATFLREEAMAEKFGIGGTQLSQKDMCTNLDIRETLELKALELAKPRLDNTELEQIACSVGSSHSISKTCYGKMIQLLEPQKGSNR